MSAATGYYTTDTESSRSTSRNSGCEGSGSSGQSTPELTATIEKTVNVERKYKLKNGTKYQLTLRNEWMTYRRTKYIPSSRTTLYVDRVRRAYTAAGGPIVLTKSFPNVNISDATIAAGCFKITK